MPYFGRSMSRRRSTTGSSGVTRSAGSMTLLRSDHRAITHSEPPARRESEIVGRAGRDPGKPDAGRSAHADRKRASPEVLRERSGVPATTEIDCSTSDPSPRALTRRQERSRGPYFGFARPQPSAQQRPLTWRVGLRSRRAGNPPGSKQSSPAERERLLRCGGPRIPSSAGLLTARAETSCRTGRAWALAAGNLSSSLRTMPRAPSPRRV